MIVSKKQPLSREYAKPLAEILFITSEGVVCNSPIDGGLEGTEEEDLVI